MKRKLRSTLSLFVVLLLAGAVMAQTEPIEPQPSAEPTATSAELSPAESGTDAPTTAPESQEATPTLSPEQEPMAEPLPKTASSLPLIAAIGLLALASAVGLGYLRHRAAASRG